MDPNPTRAPTRYTLGLYTPYLQGFYVGELVNQIRQLCHIKGYRLIIVCTGGYGKFNSPIHLNQMDGAIFIRNSVSVEFAETLVNLDKPCVTLAYDYFPLKIPVVSSDNQFGMHLAIDHLLKMPHKKIAFVGDLSHYDMRKRYESYCECHDHFQLELNENYLFAIEDSQFAGGHAAAQRFINSDCDATGIIFGTGMTGVGFIQYLQKHHPDRLEQITGICFDALPLIPVFTPQLASVDQNLHLLAYRSINTLENLLTHKTVDYHIVVQPKFINAGENPRDNYGAFMATCADLAEFNNPNYVKSIISNLFDWPREIAERQLDSLMSLSPLFTRYLDTAYLFRHFTDSGQNQWLKQIKRFLPDRAENIERSDSHSLCRIEKFPPASASDMEKHDFILHISLMVDEQPWGYLSTCGSSSNSTPGSSFLAFGGYMESLARLFAQDLEIKILRQRLRGAHLSATHAAPLEVDREALIRWEFDNGLTQWSEKALQKLGFSSAIELNIYSSMEITDRIHKDYLETVRQCVNLCRAEKTAFQTPVKFKLKNGVFHDAVLAGEAIIDGDNKIVGIQFFLGLHHV
jgi:DNA-binding LacI/PurR family transcriptional regulator